VAFPGAPESVWSGLFGGAIVIQSDEIYAITSDGTKHPL
jgi:hypothetical protein